MTIINRILGFIRKRDAHILTAFAVSTLWLAGGAWYVMNVGQWSPGENFSMESVGSFLEGVFAPLAFLWLVLGLFIQQRELSRNTKELQRTSEQSAMQTHSIAATEMNARQGTYFKIAESVKHQLGGISGMLYISALGPPGSGVMNQEQMDEHFSLAAKGDSEIFARMLISQDYQAEGGLGEIFYGTELRGKHCGNFVRTFERLRKLARNCDVDGIIEDSLAQSAFGLLYLRMIEHLPSV
jgi:hypothetical protein